MEQIASVEMHNKAQWLFFKNILPVASSQGKELD